MSIGVKIYAIFSINFIFLHHVKITVKNLNLIRIEKYKKDL